MMRVTKKVIAFMLASVMLIGLGYSGSLVNAEAGIKSVRLLKGKDYFWKRNLHEPASTNKKICTVEQYNDGVMVHTKCQGTAYIKEYGSKVLKVTVSNPSVASKNITVKVGQSKKIVSKGTKGLKVSYKSNSKNIRVTRKGYINGQSSGVGTVSAIFKDSGSNTKTVNINVTVVSSATHSNTVTITSGYDTATATVNGSTLTVKASNSKGVSLPPLSLKVTAADGSILYDTFVEYETDDATTYSGTFDLMGEKNVKVQLKFYMPGN